MSNLPFLLSIAPFAVFLFLLLVKKASLLKTSLITFILYILLGIFYWKILPEAMWLSVGKGFFTALDIFIIIFGAIFFLEILKELKIIKNISYYLSGFSKDYRVQIIVIAWFFECFMEGTAGFGTPAAIAVPILIGLGLGPIKALIVGLLGNSVPGAFGAAGTPIRVGLGNLASASVPLYTVLINSVGMIVPIFMLWTITSGKANRKKEFLDALPFALWSGLAFVVPSTLAVFLGQEFPSILGSIVGFGLVALTTRLGIFLPKETIPPENQNKEEKTMSALKAVLPYIIFITLLILGKIFLGKIGFPIKTFSHTFNLFNPGFFFILAGIITMLLWKLKIKFVSKFSFGALKGAAIPFLVVIAMSAIVQIMMNSGKNVSGLPSAIILIADAFETKLLPFFAPFISAFGAFVTGSVTISNIMFGNFFNLAGQSLSYSVPVLLSLGVVGAAAGNMVALADILTAEAVTGLENSERKILKGVFFPCLVYLSLVGAIGLLLLSV